MGGWYARRVGQSMTTLCHEAESARCPCRQSRLACRQDSPSPTLILQRAVVAGTDVRLIADHFMMAGNPPSPGLDACVDAVPADAVYARHNGHALRPQ